MLSTVALNHALNAQLVLSAQLKEQQQPFRAERDISQPQALNPALCVNQASFATQQLFHRQLKRQRLVPVFIA